MLKKEMNNDYTKIIQLLYILSNKFQKDDLKNEFQKTQENVLKFWESHHDDSMIRLMKNDLKLSYHVIDMLYSGSVEKFLEYLSDLDTYPREQLYEFLEQKANIKK